MNALFVRVLRFGCVALLLSALVGCGPTRRGDCTPRTCAEGVDCGVVDDGCEGTIDCGGCGAGKSCGGGGTANVCGAGSCEPESDEALCATLEVACGPASGMDNCQTTRSVASCGTCPDGLACESGHCASTACTAESDDTFCARHGKGCGSLTASDNCNRTRSVASCGACAAPTSCGGGGTPGECGQPGVCTPQTDRLFCSSRGKDCGSVTDFDNCDASRTVNCGTCSSPKTCGGGHVANVCGCTARETDAQLCAAAGNKTCGVVQTTDSCGAARSVSCGTCTGGKTCGAGGTPNVCGCANVETDAQACARLGATCGAIDFTDSCGDTHHVADCGSCTGGKTCGAGGRANACGGWQAMSVTSGCPDVIGHIWGTSANDVWVACGNSGAHHWNGSTWTAANVGPISRFVGSAPNNVWLISYGLHRTVLTRFDGTTYKTVSMPTLTGTYDSFEAFGTSDPSTGWIASTEGHAFKLTGLTPGTTSSSLVGTWQAQSLPLAPGGRTDQMWVRTATDMFLSGSGVMMHGDGTNWTAMTLPGDTHGNGPIHGRSANDVFTLSGSGLFHYDGVSWTRVVGFESGIPSARHLFATGDDVWLAGNSTKAFRVRGSRVGYAVLPANAPAYSVWASSATDVWVGSENGRVYRMQP